MRESDALPARPADHRSTRTGRRRAFVQTALSASAPVPDGVIILGGPTASGKTALAIALAQRFDAEIVGADSRQIYRDMPLGTAAPTDAQLAQVPHHLIGFLDPYERYSAARYVVDAAQAIAAIQARGKRAIVAGGTGFYLRALCGEVELASQPDTAVRRRVADEARAHPVEVLHAWLSARDPRRAAAVSPGDAYRVVRALEVSLGALPARGAAVGSTLPTLRASGTPYRKVALRADPVRLAERIGLRTDRMLAAGLVGEAERIGEAAVAADAVGYRDAFAYLRGWLDWNELRMLLARGTRRYAKRQLTWFRAETDIAWIDSDDLETLSRIATEFGW